MAVKPSSPTPSTPEPLGEEPQPPPWTEETVFPKVSRESHHLLYRFRCPSSGAFRCSSTGLVFLVSKKAELQYRTVQWDEALLQSSGRTPAGPLYDIECPERAVCELHLPHCEPETADLSHSGLAVAHISDSGVTFLEPLRITESHVVVQVSGLSVFGLVWNLLFKPRVVSGQVLLFCTPREHLTQKLKVNMFLLPRNVPVDLVEAKQRSTTQFIEAPYQCQLVIDQHYTVSCPSDVSVQPERALFDMDIEPNYHPLFQLCLPPKSSRVSISVREEGRTEEREVWSLDLDLPDVITEELQTAVASASFRELLSDSDSSVKQRLFSMRFEFIERVSKVVLDQVLDRLLQSGVLTAAERESATSIRERRTRAAQLIDSVLKKGSKASRLFIQDLHDQDHLLFDELLRISES